MGAVNSCRIGSEQAGTEKLGGWGDAGGGLCLPRPRASHSGRQGSLRPGPLIEAPAAQRLTPPALPPREGGEEG